METGPAQVAPTDMRNEPLPARRCAHILFDHVCSDLDLLDSDGRNTSPVE